MEFTHYIKTPKVDGAILETSHTTLHGIVCLTGHHLILYSDKENQSESIILKNVDSVEKRITTEQNSIIIRCKDFKIYTLIVPNQEDAINISNSIETLSTLTNISLHYPYFRAKSSLEEQENIVYSVKKELEELPKDNWRISEVNANFKVCNTYPPQLIVPSNITDQMILKSADFREGGRFPVLSYIHSNNTVLMRSSQPLTGSNGRRCKEDEKIINTVLKPGQRGYIVDARSTQTVQQSKSKGGGSESEYSYPQWKKIYQNIHRFTLQQESYVKFVEACVDPNITADKWMNRIETSGWFSHVTDVMNVACLISQCMDRDGFCILVHDSDGLDSTLQTTSLCRIILDPKSRTVRGFLGLVEKEWIHAGHPFRNRCFHSALSGTKPRLEGPSFTLFLDCVHQLICQYPLSFEFSSSLLVEICKHTYASEFGTFLCNNEMERQKCGSRSKTGCLWSHLCSDKVQVNYLNPFYQKRETPIWPSVAPQSITIWEDLFLPHADPNTIIRNEVVEKRDEIVSLKSDISRMNNEIDDLLRKIESSKNKAPDQDEDSTLSDRSDAVKLSEQPSENVPTSAE